MTRLDPRDMYLDLLRSYLTRYGEDELVLITPHVLLLSVGFGHAQD